jgi:hypothetical protein
MNMTSPSLTWDDDRRFTGQPRHEPKMIAINKKETHMLDATWVKQYHDKNQCGGGYY